LNLLLNDDYWPALAVRVLVAGPGFEAATGVIPKQSLMGRLRNAMDYIFSGKVLEIGQVGISRYRRKI